MTRRDEKFSGLPMDSCSFREDATSKRGIANGRPLLQFCLLIGSLIACGCNADSVAVDASRQQATNGAASPRIDLTTDDDTLPTANVPESFADDDREIADSVSESAKGTTTLIDVQAPNVVAPVTVAAATSPATARPGEVVTLMVRVRVAPGWHIYALNKNSGPAQPTQIQLELPDELTAQGAWTAPPATSQVTSLGLVSVYESEVLFQRRLEVADTAASGTHELKLQFRYQACDHTQCRAPNSTSLTVPLQIAKE